MWQIVINGPGYFDTPYDLPEGVTTLGRAEENDIVLSGDLVSRRHARFHVKGEELQVEDLGSRNGSRHNGQPLTGMVKVNAGDVVNVGENTLNVRKPARVENAATQLVDLGAGNIRFFGNDSDVGGAVLLSKDIKQSVILRALDNIAPFDMQANPFADEGARDDKTPPPVQMGNLFLLYKAAELLATSKTLQAFLEASIDRLMERVQATTAVVLVRHSTGALVPAAVRHGSLLARGEVPVSDGIVNEALKKGAALLVSDVRDDRRFRERESVVLYGADQVLCVPLGREQPFKGVLYLNLKGHEAQQLEQVLDLATALAHLISSALEKYQVTDKAPAADRLLHSFERYFPPDVAQKRVAEFVKDGSLRATKMEERQCTVLYADLAGLNRWLQGARPEQAMEVLNDFYQRFTGIVFSFEGSVAQTSGESALAVFGSPIAKGDDALRAVRSALALKADWGKHMSKRAEIDRLRLRMGLSSGKIMVGMVGIDTRLDFTAVGDSVTISTLLAAQAEPGQVLIAGKTLALIGARFDVNPLGEKVLRPGVKTPVFDVLEEDMAQLTSPGLPKSP